MVQGEPTISFPFEFSVQLNRLYGRFVWPKEAAGHINPGAPENGTGRLYQFVGKVSFASADYEGYKTSIFVRVSGWPSGARRRGSAEKKLYVCSGDPFCMLNIYSRDYGQISARSWWPTSELEWKAAKQYSYWDSTVVGLTSGCWSSCPRAAVEALASSQLELGNTQVIINFPSFISRPGTIKRNLLAGRPPPPPPVQPESSWDPHYDPSYGSSNYAPAPTGPPMDLLGGYDSPDDD